MASRTSLSLLFPGNLTSPDGIFLKAPDPKPLPLPPLQPLVPLLPPVWSGGRWRQGLGALSRCQGRGGQQGEREDAPRPARAVEKGAEGEQAAVSSTSAGGDGLSPARVRHQKMSGKGSVKAATAEKKLLPTAWETPSSIAEAQPRCCHRHLDGAGGRAPSFLPSPLFQHVIPGFLWIAPLLSCSPRAVLIGRFQQMLDQYFCTRLTDEETEA